MSLREVGVREVEASSAVCLTSHISPGSAWGVKDGKSPYRRGCCCPTSPPGQWSGCTCGPLDVRGWDLVAITLSSQGAVVSGRNEWLLFGGRGKPPQSQPRLARFTVCTKGKEF